MYRLILIFSRCYSFNKIKPSYRYCLLMYWDYFFKFTGFFVARHKVTNEAR